MENNKMSEKVTSVINSIIQVATINENFDVNLSSNIITKNSWLKLSNENLVYGFTLQNTSKL